MQTVTSKLPLAWLWGKKKKKKLGHAWPLKNKIKTLGIQIKHKQFTFGDWEFLIGHGPISFFFSLKQTPLQTSTLTHHNPYTPTLNNLSIHHTYTITTTSVGQPSPTHAFSRQTNHVANIVTTEKFVKLDHGTILPEKMMMRKRRNH